MNEKIIDCRGFNFHCPENRNYLIFEPQSQQESDRLDQLLGATALWEASIEKKRQKARHHKAYVAPFSELHPVGETSTGEAIGVVLAGAVGKADGKFYSTGQWFAVRISAGGENQLIEDLSAEIHERKQKLITELPPGSIKED